MPPESPPLQNRVHIVTAFLLHLLQAQRLAGRKEQEQIDGVEELAPSRRGLEGESKHSIRHSVSKGTCCIVAADEGAWEVGSDNEEGNGAEEDATPPRPCQVANK